MASGRRRQEVEKENDGETEKTAQNGRHLEIPLETN